MSKKIFTITAVVIAFIAVRPGLTQAPSAQQADQTAAAATVKQYCMGCHSERVKTAGIVLNPDGVGDITVGTETWEKVVRQLRSESMPPPNSPRPDHATYSKVASFLEAKLDAAQAAKPNVGDLPQLHRLTRTEYENAIRDLLALEHLPQEMDYSVLLPADNSSSGFDNIADLLFVSPAVMERYLDAARKISRLAVGDTKAPVMVNIHTIPVQHPQNERVEELPMGTRGGLAIDGYFPLDATYEVKVEVAGQARDQHLMEISVDGARVQTAQIGSAGGRGAFGGRGGRGGPGAGGPGGRGPGAGGPGAGGPGAAGPGTAGPQGGPAAAQGKGAPAPAQAKGNPAEPTPNGNPEAPVIGIQAAGRNTYRIPVKAGPHVIGVTFAQKTDVIEEGVVKPRTRSRGSQPAIQRVTIGGPYDATGPGDTPARQKIFVCKTQDTACARQIIGGLMRRAYRRPVTDNDLADLMPFYEAGKKERDFDLGIEKALERMLVSPQFLYRIERPSPTAAPGVAYPVSDLELASRMSFFLWSSIPDDELLTVAASGKLRQPDVLSAQVKRMLADPRSETLVTNFASQWLFLHDVETKEADLFLFRDFDEVLRKDLEKETTLFLDHVLRENRPVTELISAKYSFLNERLAKHYEIPGIKGSYFRKVDFPADVPRGGLLGQGAVLMLTSHATRTSPVVRGKYVLDNLLASPPPPPPPNVPSLKTEGKNSDEQLSMREAMTLHRQAPACAACHAKMDPIGFSLENFDAIGRYREVDGSGKKIDVDVQLVDGTKFTGVEGLKGVILKDPSRFVNAVAEKLMMYAIGRNVQYYDHPSVREVVRQAAAKNYEFTALVEGIVKSRPFQMRANALPKQQAQTVAENR